MENVKLALIKRIKEAMPELRLVDEDFGQLEFAGDQYPMTYPCVLVGVGETEWTTESSGPIFQHGRMPVTLKLAIDCYDDTHYGSTTEDRIVQRAALNDRLFRAVQGLQLDRNVSPFDRRRSNEYTLENGIKVYETTFERIERVRIGVTRP